MTTNTPQPSLTLAGPADILAAVPYLVGFHPADSLIVVGLARSQVKVAVRWNLPFPPGTLTPLRQLWRREGVDRVIVVGYGPGEQVTPAVDEARSLAAEAGVPLDEALRAHEGRYWSYVCDLPQCCPPEGMPYDPRTSRVAAEATVRGLVALPDRRSLEHTVAPVTGPVRVAMRRATSEAVTETRAALVRCGDANAFASAFVSAGLARVRAALTAHAAGDRLGDAVAARLGLDLTVIRVRDEAWTLTDSTHLGLWKDLTRRLEPRFVPPVASLFAMACWRAGDSTLATIALERALTIDPAYSMANLLMHALQCLLSPDVLHGRLPTPSELDTAMGPAHAGWLFPLLSILDEEDPPSAPSEEDRPPATFAEPPAKRDRQPPSALLTDHPTTISGKGERHPSPACDEQHPPTMSGSGERHPSPACDEQHPPTMSGNGERHPSPACDEQHPPTMSGNGERHPSRTCDERHPPTPSGKGERHSSPAYDEPHPPTTPREDERHPRTVTEHQARPETSPEAQPDPPATRTGITAYPRLRTGRKFCPPAWTGRAACPPPRSGRAA
ncbi:DUF4192 domain-containing protein [Nonomuraea roseoviolacea]|uniref:DUF4192 domain-containing protein n=1 Tax=Nonomuraea roseoviolacea subsp. carminata TaxID=160689 RepID=A0ABT1K6G4_9ACTN|nr:DUF4192 family protein [Nonomuraea roseoviolacea]MCP2349593.1 hypothetical protein [Nonomuraea roseoviolacea subsp. carminata]